MDTAENINIVSGSKTISRLSDIELDNLWHQYDKDRTNKELRDKLIVQYIFLVKYVVGRLRLNLPQSIATDDITGYGIEGLISSVQRFEPSKGVRFETYALMRIRGAVIDKVRSQDWIPRGTRRRFKEIKDAISKLQFKLGRQPTSEEIAEESGLTKEKVESTITEMENNTILSLHDRRDNSAESSELIDSVEDSKSRDPLAELEEKDVKKELSMALRRLPERERMILTLYYHENMTLKEIGEAVAISESRVCQLHAQAIMKLRNLLTSNKMRFKGI